MRQEISIDEIEKKIQDQGFCAVKFIGIGDLGKGSISETVQTFNSADDFCFFFKNWIQEYKIGQTFGLYECFLGQETLKNVYRRDGR